MSCFFTVFYIHEKPQPVLQDSKKVKTGKKDPFRAGEKIPNTR